jgi:hypothetical protein
MPFSMIDRIEAEYPSLLTRIPGSDVLHIVVAEPILPADTSHNKPYATTYPIDSPQAIKALLHAYPHQALHMSMRTLGLVDVVHVEHNAVTGERSIHLSGTGRVLWIPIYWGAKIYWSKEHWLVIHDDVPVIRPYTRLRDAADAAYAPLRQLVWSSGPILEQFRGYAGSPDMKEAICATLKARIYAGAALPPDVADSFAGIKIVQDATPPA